MKFRAKDDHDWWPETQILVEGVWPSTSYRSFWPIKWERCSYEFRQVRDRDLFQPIIEQLKDYADANRIDRDCWPRMRFGIVFSMRKFDDDHFLHIPCYREYVTASVLDNIVKVLAA